MADPARPSLLPSSAPSSIGGLRAALLFSSPMAVHQKRALAGALLAVDLKMENDMDVMPTTKAMDLQQGGGPRQIETDATAGGRISTAGGQIRQRKARFACAWSDPSASHGPARMLALARSCGPLMGSAGPSVGLLGLSTGFCIFAFI